MFTAAIEEILKRLNIKAGIKINGENLNNLIFADDFILFAESDENLNNLIDNLNEEGKKRQKKNEQEEN